MLEYKYQKTPRAVTELDILDNIPRRRTITILDYLILCYFTVNNYNIVLEKYPLYEKNRQTGNPVALVTSDLRHTYIHKHTEFRLTSDLRHI